MQSFVDSGEGGWGNVTRKWTYFLDSRIHGPILVLERGVEFFIEVDYSMTQLILS